MTILLSNGYDSWLPLEPSPPSPVRPSIRPSVHPLLRPLSIEPRLVTCEWQTTLRSRSVCRLTLLVETPKHACCRFHVTFLPLNQVFSLNLGPNSIGWKSSRKSSQKSSLKRRYVQTTYSWFFYCNFLTGSTWWFSWWFSGWFSGWFFFLIELGPDPGHFLQSKHLATNLY